MWRLCPCLLKQHVQGEIYDVDSTMLKKLDELEEHPAFYERTEEEILLAPEAALKPGKSFEEVIRRSCRGEGVIVESFSIFHLSSDLLSSFRSASWRKRGYTSYRDTILRCWRVLRTCLTVTAENTGWNIARSMFATHPTITERKYGEIIAGTWLLSRCSEQDSSSIDDILWTLCWAHGTIFTEN